ncbi:zinc finger protein 664 isoform X3 [Choloepus didactylus]|uniref:zinc finger protein 664 isoform X3 n=1 Tax=Choloepus didactylus TaxID=27675 RepID=UPI00189D2AD4|nr:zinc finger protein 664 isoform X3 [Choloepus didactylus]
MGLEPEPALGDREESAFRPSRARRASYSGDEGPFAHPAQNAAAAGRLHCLTTTRAGLSPRFQEDSEAVAVGPKLRDVLLCTETRSVKSQPEHGSRKTALP